MPKIFKSKKFRLLQELTKNYLEIDYFFSNLYSGFAERSPIFSAINTWFSPTKNTFLALFFKDGSTVKSNIYIKGGSEYVFSNPNIVIEFDTICVIYKDTDYNFIIESGPRPLPSIVKYTSEVIPDTGLKKGIWNHVIHHSLRTYYSFKNIRVTFQITFKSHVQHYAGRGFVILLS